jgi:flagellar capping protein FliD
VDGIDASGLNSLGEVGIRAGSEGTLTFDSATFSSKLASDFDGVEDLFILQRKLETGTPIGDLNSGQGITDAAGADFRILTRDSLTRLDIDVAGNWVLGSLLTRINSASGNGGKILARISSNGFALELVDSSSVVSRSVSAAPAPTPTTFRASEADLQGLSDDRIVGATITLTSGPNSGLVRKVSAFDTGTDVITLDSSLPVAPVAGNTYTLQRELEVQKLNGASAASELKLLGKASLGASLLAGAILNLQGDPGAAARLSETLDALTTGGDALIATRTDALDKQVAELRKSIERIDQRTEALTEKLIRDFTRLETIIAQSQSTQQRLSAFLSSLTGASGFF